VQILKGLPKDQAYAAYLRLVSRGLLLLDWAESEIEGLVDLDEDRAWPAVQRLIEEQQEWKLRGVLGHLSSHRQVECINLWLPVLKDSWFFDGILRVLQTSQMPLEDKRDVLKSLLARVQAFDGRFTEKKKLEAALKNELSTLETHAEPNPTESSTDDAPATPDR
jgi:hypothetical protein